MHKVRIITKLEVKGENVVKGIRMEGLRKVGVPDELCRKYFEQGIDEIVFEDVVASLYGRNQLTTLVSSAAEDIFIPLCVGGGVRSIEDFRSMLRSGADKVSINTQAIKTPEIITQAAQIFGSQCVIINIQAKRREDGSWQAYTENGRQPMGVTAVEWAKKAQELGAGEILLTSIDRDGTKYGYDQELIKAVTSQVRIPVIAAGGASTVEDMAKVILEGRANALCISHLLHFNKMTVADIKNGLRPYGIIVRGQKEKALV